VLIDDVRIQLDVRAKFFAANFTAIKLFIIISVASELHHDFLILNVDQEL
jgi:hypothetical protein